MKNMKIFITVISVLIVMLVSFGAQASGNPDITKNIISGELIVNATFDGCINDPVFIQIVPGDTDIDAMDDIAYGLSKTVYIDQKNSDASGNAVFNILFGKYESGNYIVRVHSMTNPGMVSDKHFQHVALNDVKNAWNNLTISPKENLSLILDACGCGDEQILSFRSDSVLLEYISDYGNIGELNSDNFDTLINRIKVDCENITIFRDAMKKIEKAENYSEVKAILKKETNANALGISDLIDRYKKLKNTRLVDKELAGKRFDSVKDFRDAFLNALVNAEKSTEDSGGSSGGSSGGTTGGSSGGAGSSTIGSSISNTSESDKNKNEAMPFKDIDGVVWAKEAIADLYSKNIINGKDADSFAPNDYILREEFVKMIVALLGVEISTAETSFSDVNPNAWYAPYIASSQRAGFIKGYSDSVFGVGNHITRQDVAVILNRIASLSVGETSVTFTDESDISDYAAEAVNNLSASGVINGSNGAFMPKSYSTRAETACMIYRLSKLMKEEV